MSQQTDKPVLLYCGRQNANDADLIRQLALSVSLVDHFRVVLMVSPHHVAQFPLMDDIEFLDAPEISVGHGGVAPSPAAERSPQAMIGLYGAIDPSVVIVEEYPFVPSADGCLEAILACSANAPRRPLMICSLLDPMCPLAFSQADLERNAGILNDRFHAVLVHADPSFSRLEEHLRTATPINVPILHCGFLSIASRKAHEKEQQQALVLLGDSGNELIVRAAVDAHRLQWSSGRTDMTIAVQPSDQVAWRWLASHAADLPGLSVRRAPAHEIGAELARSTYVVSPCTYHHMCESLASGTRALFLFDPRNAAAAEQERALRLRHLGAAALMDTRYLNGPTLALHLRRLNHVPFPASTFDFGGAENGAALVHELAAQRLANDERPLSGY